MTESEAKEKSEELERELEWEPKPKLEPKLELSVKDSKENQLEEVMEPTPQVVAIEGQVANELWQQVQELKEHDNLSKESTPLSKVKQIEYLAVVRSIFNFQRKEDEENKANDANTLPTLPSFLGEHENKT